MFFVLSTQTGAVQKQEGFFHAVQVTELGFVELFVSRNQLTPTVSLRGALARRGNPLVPLSLLRCTSGVSPGDCHGPNGPRNDMVVFTWLRRFKSVNKLGFMELFCTAPKPPLCKGRWHEVPEGLSQYKVRIRIYFRQIRNILPHNPPVSFADSPLYTRGPLAGAPI